MQDSHSIYQQCDISQQNKQFALSHNNKPTEHLPQLKLAYNSGNHKYTDQPCILQQVLISLYRPPSQKTRPPDDCKYAIITHNQRCQYGNHMDHTTFEKISFGVIDG